ncbi:hypothetical protein AB0H71_13700 [Nocardia sp. NPDC050697]|uniref:hypothetical protein n=1 Tax=Nocardia sp. NPDC050697 TaxID=3155158 RepID=UPI0033F7E817
MDNVNVPSPNPFITEWLLSRECRALVFEVGELYQAVYREIVAKRTRALARSARVSTGIEGDRWVAVMSVGGPGVPYGLSHEYGTGRTNPDNALPPANDLNAALQMMATL